MESSNRWASLRDGFAAAREMIIVASIMALFVAPSVVKSVLQKAGVSAVAGIEFSVESLETTDHDLATAQATIAELTQKLDDAKQLLASADSDGRITPVKCQQLNRIVSDAGSKVAHLQGNIDLAKKRVQKVHGRISGDLNADETATATDRKNTEKELTTSREQLAERFRSSATIR